MAIETADSSGDVVVTDRDLYDHATSDPPAPSKDTPEPAPQQQTDPEAFSKGPQPQSAESQTGERPRDEQGRFAPTKPAQQATTQQPAQQPPQQPPPQQQRQPEDNRVPVATLLQERERAYRAEAELQQMRQAWAQWQQQQAQQQAAAQQQQAPQTIYDDPDNYLRQRFADPLRQEGYQMMLQMKDGLSREYANDKFGEQAVNEALQAISQIRHTPQGDFAFRQIMSSGHPYGALVKWFNYQRAQQQIGNDPEAWFRKRAEQLLDDPRFQAAAIERARGRSQQQPGNGRTPNVQLPPSLQSLPSSSGRLEDQGDMSDQSLYRFATK